MPVEDLLQAYQRKCMVCIADRKRGIYGIFN